MYYHPPPLKVELSMGIKKHQKTVLEFKKVLSGKNVIFLENTKNS